MGWVRLNWYEENVIIFNLNGVMVFINDDNPEDAIKY
jgi:hypothetical protein